MWLFVIISLQRPKIFKKDCACPNIDYCLGVKCPTADQCHQAGICTKTSGRCTYSNKPDGTECNDRNPKTFRDTCTSGVCSGIDRCKGVECAPRACQKPDKTPVCDYRLGQCIYEYMPSGAPCSLFRDSSVLYGTCKGAVCVPNDLQICEENDIVCPPIANGIEDICANVTCPPADQCQEGIGNCNPDTGLCEFLNAPDGKDCLDSNPLTKSDRCILGVCESGLCSEFCAEPDQCHRGVGTCNPASGQCTFEKQPVGTECNDNDPTTIQDHCNADGTCVGIPRCQGVVCSSQQRMCQTDGVCDPFTGVCRYMDLSSSTICKTGEYRLHPQFLDLEADSNAQSILVNIPVTLTSTSSAECLAAAQQLSRSDRSFTLLTDASDRPIMCTTSCNDSQKNPVWDPINDIACSKISFCPVSGCSLAVESGGTRAVMFNTYLDHCLGRCANTSSSRLVLTKTGLFQLFVDPCAIINSL